MLVARTLGEICDEVRGTVRTGPFGSQLHESDYCEQGLPVVMPKNILDGRISLDGIARIGEDDALRLAQHRLKKGDIVYGRRGDIGRRALIGDREEGWLCGTGCLRISLGDSVVDPFFLYYFLGQPSVTAWIYNQAIGATLPNLNTDIIRSVVIRYPPLIAQRKIAAVLSAYDDLIENNTRRIAILEEMARLIYREWFVHLRFPGHDKVKMVDSPQGRIPEGWQTKPIGDVVETLGGGTPSTNKPEYWNGGEVTWFTPSDLTSAGSMFIGDSSKKITKLGLQESSAKLFPPYSVMMTSRATIGVTAINTREACTNQGFIVCVANNRLSAWQIYYWIEQNREQITSIASGATYKEINRSEFRDLCITVADSKTSSRFVEILNPIAKEIEILLVKNANLRRTRDLLLPKLVSGEIDVSDLECAT